MLDGFGIKPGQFVRVRQEIDRREGSWTNEVVGAVVEVKSEKTGSWHAHGQDDKLWLNRICLRKPDGELTTLVIDQHTQVEIISNTSE